MKSKKIITLALAAAMVCTSAVSVYAAELTNTNQEGQTEVKARIDGSVTGDVTYVIEIPDVVDFGTLTMPENTTEDSFRDVVTHVTAKTITNLDEETQKISVYVRDKDATSEDSDFRITNKVDSSKKFNYDVYDVTENLDTTQSVNSSPMTSSIGFKIAEFIHEGEIQDLTLRLNQHDLCDYNITEIVGDYSGYMVFYSMLENQ